MNLIIGIDPNHDRDAILAYGIDDLIKMPPPINEINGTVNMRGMCGYNVHGNIFGYTSNNEHTGGGIHNRYIVLTRFETFVVSGIPWGALVQPNFTTIVAGV